MNARKSLSLLAALLLSIGTFGGAVAQTTDSAPVNVTLTNNATETCGIDISVSSGTFGSWEFDSGSGEYLNTDLNGISSIDFTGNLDVEAPNGCDVTISFGGLSNGTDSIDTTHFSATSFFQGQAVAPASFGNTGVGAGSLGLVNYDFQYTLNDVPNTLAPDVYEGTIEALVSNTV